MRINRPSQDAEDLSDIAASGVPLAADPEMIQAALDALKGGDAAGLSDIARSGAPLAADPDALQAGLDSARGGVSQDAMDLSDLAASGVPLAADPEMIQAALDAMAGKPSQDANDLSDIAASGFPLAADPEALDAGLKDARGYADGGVVGAADDDPSVIPEDVRQYVDEAHKARQESRPDESWRIAPQDKEEPVSTYKQEDEEMPEAEAAPMGDVPGYAAGGMVPDPNDLLASIAPAGTGSLVPSPADQPAPMAPAPAPAIPPAPAMGTPSPAAPQPTDADFTAKANKLLGLDQGQQAGFLKMLGDKSRTAQLGAGLAGVGDAIASAGTLGKVNPHGLDKAEALIEGNTKAGLEGMQTIRGNQKDAQELGDKLQARDPEGPLSKWAQKAYAGLGKKIGLDLSHAPASMIADLAGKGVEALNTEMLNQLKLIQIDLQKKTLEATTANQKAERDISRQGQQLSASEKLGSRTLGNKIEGIFPGTPAHTQKQTLERIAAGYTPDVLAYAQKHGISPEEAQAVKDKRNTGR